MKEILLVFILTISLISCTENKKNEPEVFDKQAESAKILKSIENWNSGWETKNVELAIKDYSEKTDWTNAFGARVQSKEELQELLEEIFAMDFVMEGKDSYKNEAVEFLSNEIALLRSINIRTGQKWSDGSLMEDRHIHHLRVFQKIGNEWQIISHMINQANEKD
ncbi:MAG: DUF4440 domain-containing protein [Bacteroidia bacterium]|nr:DUF4440 domain-containing protein [Bacteroidia bacterium]